MDQAISHENGASIVMLVESRNSQKSVYAEEYPAWNEPGQFLRRLVLLRASQTGSLTEKEVSDLAEYLKSL